MARSIVQAAESGGSPADNEMLTSPIVDETEFGEPLRLTAQDLIDTMNSQELCVGLAAPQIGVRKRIAVALVDEDEVLVMVNPTVVSASGKKDTKRESCMSLFGWTAEVERREKVLISYADLDGQRHERALRKFAARVVQHEIDHLDGVLYRDRADEKLQATNLFDGSSPEA